MPNGIKFKMTYNDINFDLARVIIYLEHLPIEIKNELFNLLEIIKKEDKKEINISQEELNACDIEKFPDAENKLILFGDCSKWTEDFRKIIRIVRKHTLCVLIE